MDGRPAITIVIDDLGVLHRDQPRARPAGAADPVMVPVRPGLAEQVAEGVARGHETTLHMPMQAGPHTEASVGPNPLRVDLPPAVNLARLRDALAAVPGIVGFNNHMGTVATRDAALMNLVAQEAKSQGMLFLDSVVIPHSEGVRRCDAAGVPTAARDVFIDNTAKPADIAASLAEIEAHARRTGHCIAIGHPRPHTLDALEAWLPTLPAQGLCVVAAVRHRGLAQRVAAAGLRKTGQGASRLLRVQGSALALSFLSRGRKQASRAGMNTRLAISVQPRLREQQRRPCSPCRDAPTAPASRTPCRWSARRTGWPAPSASPAPLAAPARQFITK